jgi:hypothetical protein
MQVKHILTSYTVTPEEFHSWNPSVGLDCQPWYFASYCIITQEKLDTVEPNTASSRSSKVFFTSTKTTASSSLAPSPTTWTGLGCYAQNAKGPVLEEDMSPVGGDASLSIPKCKDSCYRRAYRYAGVREGNQCWCSSYVDGDWAKNQTDCDVPCTGDKATFCGGKGVLSIFKAMENETPDISSTSTGGKAATETPAISSTSTGVQVASATAGAVRNRAFSWLSFSDNIHSPRIHLVE